MESPASASGRKGKPIWQPFSSFFLLFPLFSLSIYWRPPAGGVRGLFPSKKGWILLERMYRSCVVSLWICILTVFLPLYSVHWVVLYRCVSYRCVAHVSLPVPGAFICSVFKPVSIHTAVSTFFNTERYKPIHDQAESPPQRLLWTW